jgi:putative phosphonate metabolism protein
LKEGRPEAHVTARYAIFYAPAGYTPLWQFGSGVIGYDAATGTDVSAGPLPLENWLALTEEPRRYGFHATLKAPFSLAEGLAEDDLLGAAAGFAQARAAFAMPRLHVAQLGGFIALVASQPSPDLNALAGDCVRDFEPLRAPLGAADLARRLKTPLSERQTANLHAWGYPHVFADFRFHMTLSGPLPAALQAPALAALAERYATVSPPPLLDAVCIFKQADRAGRFRILARFDLVG